ncbi:hypothetical protein AHF37_02200 [Paragonimus kellicotti]|nr:hypothetical protein AHF37_02200 [Paragonimus kellicotti]
MSEPIVWSEAHFLSSFVGRSDHNALRDLLNAIAIDVGIRSSTQMQIGWRLLLENGFQSMLWHRSMRSLYTDMRAML